MSKSYAGIAPSAYFWRAFGAETTGTTPTAMQIASGPDFEHVSVPPYPMDRAR